MTSERPFAVLCWAGLLVFAGSACGKSTPSGGEGGSQGSGGDLPGAGGESASGGVPAGGASGVDTGGVSGTGGKTTIRDAAPSDSTSGDGACVPDYACKLASPNTGDMYVDCVARVNQFRACVCLPPLPRWTAGEACADQDAKYDAQQNTPHGGFQAAICASGNAQDECPDWAGNTPQKVIEGCLQKMFDEGPPPTGTCTGQCYADHGHYLNMTGTKYKNGVACGFYTTASGRLWAVQNFQ